MLKKNLIILFIIFCILCISNVCFANTTNNVKSGVNSATTTVVDGAKNLANDVRNGVGAVENGIEGALTMDTNTTNHNTTTHNTTTATTDNYTAARTATTTNATGTRTSTMWVWAIVAVATIGIIGLVWYYGSQNRVD